MAAGTGHPSFFLGHDSDSAPHCVQGFYSIVSFVVTIGHKPLYTTAGWKVGCRVCRVCRYRYDGRQHTSSSQWTYKVLAMLLPPSSCFAVVRNLEERVKCRTSIPVRKKHTSPITKIFDTNQTKTPNNMPFIIHFIFIHSSPQSSKKVS